MKSPKLHKGIKNFVAILNATAIRRCTSPPSHVANASTGRIKRVFQHPLLRNMCTMGILYGAADTTRQIVTQHISWDKWDSKSCARIAATGAFVLGPIYTLWYPWLDKKFIGNGTKIVIKKILMDQCILGPHLIVGFYVATSLMEGKDPVAEVKNKFIKTFMAGCCFWPAVQSINFLFLPTHLRTTYVACAAFIWTNIICYIKSC